MRRALCLLLLFTSAAHGYVQNTTDDGVPIRWGTNCVDFHLNEAGSRDVELEVLEGEVEASLAPWSAVDCADVRLTWRGLTSDDQVGYFAGETNRNIIIWRDAPGSWPEAPTTVAFAMTSYCVRAGRGCPFVGALIDVDIEVNGEHFAFQPTSGTARDRFDVRNTLTHEVGHALGLGHSLDPEATMYEDAPPGERKKADLHADDIEGICAIYPARSDGPRCVDYDGPGSEAARSTDDCCAVVGGHGTGSPWWLALAALAIRRRR